MDNADDLPEILAGASALAGQPVTVAALEAAMAAGLLQFDDLHVHFRHPLVRSGVLQLETVTRRYAANAALAEVLAGEPYRRTWHRAQSVSGQNDQVADELEAAHVVSLRRGSATEAIWALERSAQLTTDPARRGRRLLLAAEHAFGLGRADLVDQLLTRAARTSLSRLDHARMAWLREIFNDGVPGDADRVLALCDLALEAIGASESGLALNLLRGAALRCWWADTGPAARARVTEVAHLIGDGADDPRYAAVLAVADPVLQGQEVTQILDGVVLETLADPGALWLLGQAAHAIGDLVRAADFLSRAETKLRQHGRLGLLSQVLADQGSTGRHRGPGGRGGHHPGPHPAPAAVLRQGGPGRRRRGRGPVHRGTAGRPDPLALAAGQARARLRPVAAPPAAGHVGAAAAALGPAHLRADRRPQLGRASPIRAARGRGADPGPGA